MQGREKLLNGTFVYSDVFSENVIVRIGLQGVFALFIRAHRENRGISVFDISVEGNEFIAAAVYFEGKRHADYQSYSAFYLVDLSYNFSHTLIISFCVLNKRIHGIYP